MINDNSKCTDANKLAFTNQSYLVVELAKASIDTGYTLLLELFIMFLYFTLPLEQKMEISVCLKDS